MSGKNNRIYISTIANSCVFIPKKVVTYEIHEKKYLKKDSE
jgi:hypothetical protein